MRNGWWTKGLVCGIICLFIGVSISSSITAHLEDNKMYSVVNPIGVLSISSENKGEKSMGCTDNIGLVGYWNFDEGYGNIAKDESGYNNHGEVSGANWTSDSIINNALKFDGDRDYVFVQDDESLNFADTNEFTLDIWVKWDGTISTDHGAQAIIHKAYISGYYLMMFNNGTIIFFISR